MPSAAQDEVLQAMLEQRAAQKRREMAAPAMAGPPVDLPFSNRIAGAFEASEGMPEPSQELYAAKHRRAQGLPPETSFWEEAASIPGRAWGGAQKMWQMTGAAPRALYEDPLGTINRAGLAGQAATDAIVRGAVTPFTQFGRSDVPPEQQAFDLASVLAGGGLATAGGRAGVGVFGGRLAKTADIGKLTRATDMKNGGFTPEEIWKETGWFQGADDRWRFEIPDQGAYFYHAGKDRIAAGEEVPLSGGSTTGSGGVFAHPQLYEAYPQLRDIKLHNRASEGTFGTSYGGNIGLAPKWRGDMESTLLHELQHEVQDIEGFAKGGQTKQFAMDPASMANAQKHLDDLLAAQSLQHEVRSGGVDLKTAIKLHKELGMTITPYAENMAGVAAPEILEKDIASVLKNIELAARGGYAGYSRLAGETEARNVQKRAKMSLEEARAAHPSTTQDVPRGEQIVRGVR